MTWFYSLFTLHLGLRSLHWEKKAPDKMQREAQEVLCFCSSLGTGPEDGRVVSGTVGNVFDHAWIWAHLSRARQGYCATVSTGLITRRPGGGAGVRWVPPGGGAPHAIHFQWSRWCGSRWTKKRRLRGSSGSEGPSRIKPMTILKNLTLS